MDGPRHPFGQPDRHIECQEALERQVIAIFDAGNAAGWTTAEVATALIALADNIMLADAANRQTDKEIEAALRKLGL